MKLRLWVEADGHDDMDLFVAIRKLDEKGNWIPVHVLGEPHPGRWGRCAYPIASSTRRWSTDFQPVQAHRKEEKLKPGEIVPVDIEIWPTAGSGTKASSSVSMVSGHYISEGWFEPLECVQPRKQRQPHHPYRREV